MLSDWRKGWSGAPRRKLLLGSVAAVAVALAALAGAFRLLEGSSPRAQGDLSTCPAAAPPPDCNACIAAGCGPGRP